MDFAFGPPPPGGDKNRGSIILALDGLIFGISWTMVLMRLGVRTGITRNLGWDDATIFLAALTNSVGLGFYVCLILYGLGRHKYYLSDYDYKMLLKWDYLDWIQMFFTLVISKISIFFSILTDFIGAGFPILLLWNVKIKIGSKVAIWLLMGFGVM
ncbi:MAG: hypothetical protein Q9199_004650 [Rusavskia elegans]